MSPPALVTAFVALTCGAWLFAVPPGSSPDEPAHYVKALGAGQGEFYGEPHVVSAAERRAFIEAGARGDPNLDALFRVARSRAFRWQQRTTRQFRVSTELVAAQFGCTLSQPEVTGACLEEPAVPLRRRSLPTYAGTYQPYVYVPSGLTMRAGSSPADALRLGRAAILVISAGLLAAAAWLLWAPRAGALSLLGLVVAMTPMVLYLSSVLSPSGPEIAGAICFCAALLRLGRDEPPPSWLWAALAAGGVTLAGTRALGPAFTLVNLALVALIVGPGSLWRGLRGEARGTAIAGGAILVAVAASLVWEFTRQPRPDPTGESLLDAIGPSLSHLPDMARQAVGVFGGLDAPMPAPGYVLWAVLLALLAGAAAALGDRRERLTLGALTGAIVGVTLVMSVVYREIGPLHGRYALPVLVLLPLYASEVVLRRRERLTATQRRGLVVSSFGLAAVAHALGWWASARRFAVGIDGPWVFPSDAAWAPPLGWTPWILACAVASLVLLAAGLQSTAASARPAGTSPTTT